MARGRDAALQTAALRSLSVVDDADFKETLAGNLLVWIESSAPKLMIAVAESLPRRAQRLALETLFRLANDTNHPCVSAAHAVVGLNPPCQTFQLGQLRSSIAQHTRTVVLLELKSRSNTNDADVSEIIEATLFGNCRRLNSQTLILLYPAEEALATFASHLTERLLKTIHRVRAVEIRQPIPGLLISQRLPQHRMAEDAPEESTARRRTKVRPKDMTKSAIVLL